MNSTDLAALNRLVPSHMHDSIVAWVGRAEPEPQFMGDFLYALLSNDLMGAFSYADDENTAAMRGWVQWLYSYAPSPCYGSPKRLDDWWKSHHPDANESKEREDLDPSHP